MDPYKRLVTMMALIALLAILVLSCGEVSKLEQCKAECRVEGFVKQWGATELGDCYSVCNDRYGPTPAPEGG